MGTAGRAETLKGLLCLHHASIGTISVSVVAVSSSLPEAGLESSEFIGLLASDGGWAKCLSSGWKGR